jgi:hypothetical protein
MAFNTGIWMVKTFFANTADEPDDPTVIFDYTVHHS